MDRIYIPQSLYLFQNKTNQNNTDNSVHDQSMLDRVQFYCANIHSCK